MVEETKYSKLGELIVKKLRLQDEAKELDEKIESLKRKICREDYYIIQAQAREGYSNDDRH